MIEMEREGKFLLIFFITLFTINYYLLILILYVLTILRIILNMFEIEKGFTILSSKKLFNHWYRPVFSIIAKAKRVESTAANVEELEAEVCLLVFVFWFHFHDLLLF